MRLALAALALTGCATMFASGPDYVPVSTNPPGAWVYLNGVPVGQTPTTVRLDRGRPAQIQIGLEGFQPVVFQRDSEINGWFWVNILWVAAIVPWVIDIVDGNWMRYDDEPIMIGLTPLPQQQSPIMRQPPPMPPGASPMQYPPAQ
ncbi:MAG: PEGA domain-containing protein [Kofleriaceae bacterium]